jgi:hypothetical protein
VKGAASVVAKLGKHPKKGVRMLVIGTSGETAQMDKFCKVRGRLCV